ncbi:MAG: hypothetical protein ACLPXW_11420 [Xanthobacteraceae bacterium]
MTRRISIHAVFDTCGLYTKSADQFLSRNVSELIKAPPNLSVDVHWYVPNVVKLEREYQMLEEAKTFLPYLKKADRLFGTSSAATMERTHVRIKELIAESIKAHGINVPKFDAHAVDWVRTVEDAVFRLPPFEAGDKEKGFRDAMVMETFCQLHKTLNFSAPNELVLITSDDLLAKAVTLRVGDSPTVMIHENIEALKTSLVAFSTELDPKEARELVRIARTFLNDKLTVGRLHEIIFEKYGAQLRTSPDGKNLSAWQIMVGDTALFAMKATKVIFQTTVLVYSQATRPVQNLPFVQITDIGPNSPLTNISKSTVAVPQSSTISVSGDTWGAGTAFGTISSVMPSTINISSPMVATGGISVLTNIGRHTLNIRWSATLSDHKLDQFEVLEVEYEGVVWE